MNYSKAKLLEIAKKIEEKKELSPSDISALCTFDYEPHENNSLRLLKQLAIPLSLAFGFFFSVFPSYFDSLVKQMPLWSNFSPEILIGVDYLWDLLGDPVRKANIIYHVPNVVLYSFGVIGVKKLFDALDKRTWLDRVLAARTILQVHIKEGRLNLSLRKGHSILFVGNGDFIGAQFVLSHKPDASITISLAKPLYTDIWNYYNPDTTYQDLKDVLENADSENAGEYIFFPVKDDQIFLPSPLAYDVSPHKLDILCQNIRTIEKENKWKEKRIIIVGDRYHRSYVQSEDKKGPIKHTEDIISLGSITKKYKNVTIIDPSDVVIKRIIELAKGRKTVFRATKDGIAEYKKRFYTRLEKLGYKNKSTRKGILTIGYDLFEDQTEQQTLARVVDDYYPVVLSKNVRDALLRNGYKSNEFIYVPELVLTTISKIAEEQ